MFQSFGLSGSELTYKWSIAITWSMKRVQTLPKYLCSCLLSLLIITTYKKINSFSTQSTNRLYAKKAYTSTLYSGASFDMYQLSWIILLAILALSSQFRSSHANALSDISLRSPIYAKRQDNSTAQLNWEPKYSLCTADIEDELRKSFEDYQILVNFALSRESDLPDHFR